MDCRTPAVTPPQSGDHRIESGPDPIPCDGPAVAGGKVVGAGRAFVRTVHHFFPEWNRWLNEWPDTRYQPFVEYHQRFLAWWGLLLFCCELASRRQLDYRLRDLDTHVLENVNRLANTNQESLPVHKTLDHFLGHVGSIPLAGLRPRAMHHLMRQRVLDAGRLLGHYVVALDGTGHLVFGQPHCPHCLTQKSEHETVYLHPVLEAKLVDPRGLALSLGTEFIENTEPANPIPACADYEKIKQDCELKAWQRLAPELKRAFPRTALCWSADSLYACGPGFTICEQNNWAYVFTFKPGRTPALWSDFEGLLALVPENRLDVDLADGTHQHHRWVNALEYRDSEGRPHRPNALLCEETRNGQSTRFAWLTNLRVDASTVIAIAEKGGRLRSKIENEGFNTQKNSGLALEHAYSCDPENSKTFYLLLQIAHMLLQLFEHGSLLRQVAREAGGECRQVFGSLKNIPQLLLECLRYFAIPAEAFDADQTAHCQVRLDSS